MISENLKHDIRVFLITRVYSWERAEAATELDALLDKFREEILAEVDPDRPDCDSCDLIKDCDNCEEKRPAEPWYANI